jgi:hypothetical protein
VAERHLLSAEEAADGWISLFDGDTLFGWTPNDAAVNWQVKNHAITADQGPIGLLLTTVPFSDFELVCEYRMSEDGNSGVFLRTLPKPADPARDGYEVNIVDSHPQGFLTGSHVARQKASEQLTGSGDWQTLRMTAQGNHFTTQFNGRLVLDYTDESPGFRRQGLIGLQKNVGKIEFRKMVLRPLGLEPLFNGHDLTGWREVPGSRSHWTVDEGAIHIVGGPGFWETERTFQDFLLQTQARTNSADLNSGFFFRAMPGTAEAPSNGYEVQIHNGFSNDDRTRPTNAGTGAIFRRAEARRVVPNDQAWCTLTLAAFGPRMAVWVDGYQVVDWEDTRAADENPRKGRRLEGGHISLQGHDETTDVSFRRLRVAEYPESP